MGPPLHTGFRYGNGRFWTATQEFRESVKPINFELPLRLNLDNLCDTLH
jgi:hypothetical protein